MIKEKLHTGGGVARRSAPRVLVLLTMVAVFAVAGYFAYSMLGSREKKERTQVTTRVERGSMDLTISASGTVKPEHEVKISPKVTGLIKKLLVSQGQKVKKGELIALMDDSNLIGQVEAARSALNLAEANYDKAVNGNRPQEIAEAEAQVRKSEDGVRFANQAVNRARALVKSREAELLRDKTNAMRMKQLAQEGAVSDQDRLNAVTVENVAQISLEQARQEFQQAVAGLAQTRADLDTAKQRFSLLRAGSREEDVRAAQHAREQARGQLKYLESQLNDTRIKAPFDGIISQEYAEEGSIVTPTTSAATDSATSSSIVSLASRLEVIAYVSETDMGHLKIGQPTRIVANAYPDREFHGKVTLIAPAAVVTQNVTTFEVHSSIDDDPEENLMSGMNVNAEFLAGKLENVLIVPTVCVISEKGKTGVLVPDAEGKPRFHPIKAGRTAGSDTRVISGLKEGDLVLTSLSKEELGKRGYQESSSSGRGMRRMGMPRRH
ncbi:MAG: efflux RND transporter periplasmic adaptor subunit [Candidatus Melainabacteria bacterium]|nr:efflux RND transporter periplasmic adaptor subunit [Candidatus Melainabacteria bacterium]